MTQAFPTLFCCIPMMDELENVDILYNSLKQQDTNYLVKIICCVNQPLSWWEYEQKKTVCDNNQKTIEKLQAFQDNNLIIIDRSSKSLTYQHQGVGWARKIAMDYAITLAKDDDMIFSMDADTFYPTNYLEQTATYLLKNPNKLGISADYFHPLSDCEADSRAMLRYEFFMRNYELNMFRITSPYRFTAIGSGIACWVWAYKKIGGMPIKQAGEDFYFMEKLCKNGEILYNSPIPIYPQPRHSDRVLFGTGPVIQSASKNNWSRYPIYASQHFDSIKKLYEHFESYYTENRLSAYLTEKLSLIFNQLDWIAKLKQHSNTKDAFMKKVHVKFDGLRILRLLKQLHQPQTEEITLKENLLTHYSCQINHQEKEILLHLDFKTTSIEDLDTIRKRMCSIKQHYINR